MIVVIKCTGYTCQDIPKTLLLREKVNREISHQNIKLDSHVLKQGLGHGFFLNVCNSTSQGYDLGQYLNFFLIRKEV